jgi:hypothetical protein
MHSRNWCPIFSTLCVPDLEDSLRCTLPLNTLAFRREVQAWRRSVRDKTTHPIHIYAKHSTTFESQYWLWYLPGWMRILKRNEALQANVFDSYMPSAESVVLPKSCKDANVSSCNTKVRYILLLHLKYARPFSCQTPG